MTAGCDVSVCCPTKYLRCRGGGSSQLVGFQALRQAAALELHHLLLQPRRRRSQAGTLPLAALPRKLLLGQSEVFGSALLLELLHMVVLPRGKKKG